MKILRAADYRWMPWKNGGGETAEILAFPPGASMDDFDWRISMADVTGDGPFSSFPGIDRTLTLLSGNGVALDIDGQGRIVLDPSSPPHAFPGDVPVMASLTDGPVRDLNVMSRRGRYSHRVLPIEVEGHCELPIGSDIAVLFCRTGEVSVGEARLGALDAVMTRRGLLDLSGTASLCLVLLRNE